LQIQDSWLTLTSKDCARPVDGSFAFGGVHGSKALRVVLLVVAALLSTAAGALEQETSAGVISMLKSLSIADLGKIEVTSVSRTTESLGSAAAAVAVVTQQDIRRSSATSVPEALRGLPGIYVGRRNANSWAISSRGFSSINSEKLLVLSDTRSIYTPLLSGVQWDVQNYIMADIERIEVIRGPGATQWGSNSVNGVINITTRNARDTQGLFVEGRGGSEEHAALAVRNGGRIGERGYYRVFGQYFDRDASQLADPSSSDDWHMAHAGFRTDWEAGTADAFTLQGDWYDGRVGHLAPAISIEGRPGPPPPLRVQLNGGNLLGRWRRTLDADGSFEFRAYYDRTHRDDPSFRDDLDTIDLDFQHQFALPAQRLIWGLNYRWSSNRNRGKGLFAVDPPRSRDELFSGFLQDQIAINDSLHLTLGTKLEHNDFSGVEIQPSARLAWEMPQAQTLWAAVSRAVRVPTRLERDIAIEITAPGADPAGRLLGNRDFDSEKLIAYELGYRRQVSRRLSVDMAAFLNRYRGLASLEVGTPFTDPEDGRTVYPVVNENLTDGRAAGMEALVNFAPTDRWRLTASYSYLDMNISPDGQDLNRGQFADGSTPRHQWGLRSAVDVGPLQIDAFLRRVGAIRRDPQITTGEGIPAYTELDLRFARQWKQIEFAVTMQNLLHDQHLEFGTPAHRGGIERSVHASIVWEQQQR
jgi:iron complex outermembrane recepter protein